jgi:hypothetical protein
MASTIDHFSNNTWYDNTPIDKYIVTASRAVRNGKTRLFVGSSSSSDKLPRLCNNLRKSGNGAVNA